jgi:hypothetical protein
MHAPDGALAASAQRSPDDADLRAASELRLQRVLKLVVVALAILLFAGLAAAIWRVIYLASGRATQPATPALAIRPEQSLALPAGAQVRSISLSGDRLAVHYDAGGEAGIAIFDLQTGRKVTDIDVEREPAGAGPPAP